MVVQVLRGKLRHGSDGAKGSGCRREESRPGVLRCFYLQDVIKKMSGQEGG